MGIRNEATKTAISQDTLKNKPNARHSIQQEEYLDRRVDPQEFPGYFGETLCQSLPLCLKNQGTHEAPHPAPSSSEGSPKIASGAQSEEPPRENSASQRPLGPNSWTSR